MEEKLNYSTTDAKNKLKFLIKELSMCLLSTKLKSGEAAVTRPMSAYISESDDFIWFFSQRDSNKNREIENGNYVQLYFSDAAKSTYFSIAGTAEIILNDRNKIDELWNPFLKTWFQDGKEDENLSLIKVTPDTGYYWDTKGNRIINLFKMAASVVLGKDLVNGEEGKLKF